MPEASARQPLYRSAVRLVTQPLGAGLCGGAVGTLIAIVFNEGSLGRAFLFLTLAFAGGAGLLTVLEEMGRRRSSSAREYLLLLILGAPLGLTIVVLVVQWGIGVLLEGRTPLETLSRGLGVLADGLLHHTGEFLAWTGGVSAPLFAVGAARGFALPHWLRAVVGAVGGAAFIAVVMSLRDRTLQTEPIVVFAAGTAAATLGMSAGAWLEERLERGHQARLTRD